MRLVVLVPALLMLISGTAEAQTWSRSAKLSKGKATVAFTALSPEGAQGTAIKQPRVGIAPSPSSTFGPILAQQLDLAGRTSVVPPNRLSGAAAFNTAGFDSMMREELISAVGSACRQSRIDYLLLMGTPQASTKTDITAMIFFVGRTRMRNRGESRLYDCRTKQAVWVQNVLFETSQGVVSAGFGGMNVGALGSVEAERAMAKIYVEKLTMDMGW